MMQLAVSVVFVVVPAFVIYCGTSTASVIIEVNPHKGQDNEGCMNYALQPCATLAYALALSHHYDDVQLRLTEPELYDIVEAIIIKDKQRFELTGPEEGVATIQCEEPTAGLSFAESSNILLSRVIVSGCGSLQPSSSSNLNRATANEAHYIPIQVGISFILCNNVTLTQITVQDSHGTGVIFYNNGGYNVIRYSGFLANGVSHIGGGGARVEFLYCLPGDFDCSDSNGSSIPETNKHNVTFEFVNCTFVDNYASGHLTPNGTNNAFISSHSNHHFTLGRGGGLGLVFEGNTSHVSVKIDSCNFSNNSAVWGGGAFISFHGSDVSHNTVSVKSTTFINNFCSYDPCSYDGTGGGGVRAVYGGYGGIGLNNKLVFNNTHFTDNQAYFGGGFSASIIPEDLSNTIEFNGITWEGNVARLGSAVDLSMWNVFFGTTIPTTTFRDCIFINNSVLYTEKVGIAIGTGTIYSDTVPIEFIGSIHCGGNQGTCVYSVEASIKFATKTNATFTGNSAYNGGALALFSNSYLMLSEGCQLEFVDNHALIHGGAIYWEGVGNRYLVSAQNCFIRYQNIVIDPSEWVVSVTFAGNTARVTGNDIFGTTLLGCVRNIEGSGEQSDTIKQEYDRIFNWNPEVWHYDNFTDNSIATAPSNFVKNGELNCGQPYYMEAVPGKLTQLSVRMRDDRNVLYPVDSLVFSAIVNDSNDTAQYLASGELPFTGNEGEVKEYSIATLQPRVISSKVYLTLQRCPFGFRFDTIDFDCDGAGYPFLQTHTNFSSSIQRGYWIGLIDGKTVVSQCFFCPYNKQLPPSNFILLPPDNETTDFFCDGLNRMGKLCQECKEGYGLAISSERFSCVKCTQADSSSSWLLYILGKYLPITLILLLVIIFNISVTSGYANSFAVFAQLISTTFGVDAGQIINFSSIAPSADFLRRLYVSLYGLWNLDFFDSFNIILHCFSTKVSVLHYLVLNYVTAIYPLLLLSVIVIILALYDRSNRVVVFFLKPIHRLLARCLQFLDLKRSIMDAFATFVVLSYAKFAVISAFLLYPSSLLDADGNAVKYVSYFDHTKGYTSIEYAPYFISALLVMLIGFLLPVMLFLYSVKPFNRFLQEHRLSFLLPGEKTKYFLNSFYHCYKDGRDGGHDRRYFASLYFFVRFVFIYFYAIAYSWAIQFLMQQVTLTAVIIVISVFQPYKNNFFNIIDAVMFGLLAVINVFTLYQTYLDVADIPLSRTCYWLQILVIFLPLVYICSVLIYFTIYKYLKKVTSRKMQERRQKKRLLSAGSSGSPSIDDFSYGEFMNDVDAEDRFTQVNYHGPLKPDGMYTNSSNSSTYEPNTPPSSATICVTDREDSNKRKNTLADYVVVAREDDVLESWEDMQEAFSTDKELAESAH